VGVIKCPLCSGQLQEFNHNTDDIRPIFAEEKKRYNQITSCSSSLDCLPDKVCFESRNNILIDGRNVLKIRFDPKDSDWRAVALPKEKIELGSLQGSDMDTMIRANEKYLRKMERESVKFLEKIIAVSPFPAIVSFSGGKDSLCSLALTREVDKNIPAVFLNSTIEFPETLEYVEDIWRTTKLDLIQLLPEHDFFELCSLLGPPSCFMPWCCQTQKFSVLSSFINRYNEQGILSIEGLRNRESKQRRNYGRISANRAIPRKTTICPIINWTTFDVWLYILWKKISINPLYKEGFSRVGCWICPHKGRHDFRLAELLHPELTKKWHDFLSNYAKGNGKDSTWITDGKWRSRREAYNKIEQNKKITIDCSYENSSVYTISNVNYSEIVEFMKIFGHPTESYINGKKQTVCIINGQDIRITIISRKIMVLSKRKSLMRAFERQLLKALNCVRCGACMGTCSAIKVSKTKFSVNIKSCTHCLKCTTSEYLRMGCVALNYKKDRFVWKEIM
jgi:phosphoadenosine phosphosulfate reductase